MAAARSVVCDLCGRSFFQDSLRFHRPACLKKQEHLEVPCHGCGLYVQKSFLAEHMKKCDIVGAERRRSPTKSKMQNTRNVSACLPSQNEQLLEDGKKSEKKLNSLLKICERMANDVKSYKEEARVNQHTIDALLARGVDKSNLSQPIQVLKETLLVIKSCQQRYQENLKTLYSLIENSPFCLAVVSIAESEAIQQWGAEHEKYIKGIYHAQQLLMKDFPKFSSFPRPAPVQDALKTHLSGGTRSAEPYSEITIHGKPGADGRLPCNICQRKFAPDRIHEHYRICGKLSVKKQRKPFSSRSKRLNGVLPPEIRKQVIEELNGKKVNTKYHLDWHSNWRQKHQELLEVANAMRGNTKHTIEMGKSNNLARSKALKIAAPSMTHISTPDKKDSKDKLILKKHRHPPTSDIKAPYRQDLFSPQSNDDNQAVSDLLLQNNNTKNVDSGTVGSPELPHETLLVSNDKVPFLRHPIEQGFSQDVQRYTPDRYTTNSRPVCGETSQDPHKSNTQVPPPPPSSQEKKKTANFIEYTSCNKCGKRLPVTNLQLHELRCPSSESKIDKRSLPNPPEKVYQSSSQNSRFQGKHSDHQRHFQSTKTERQPKKVNGIASTCVQPPPIPTSAQNKAAINSLPKRSTQASTLNSTPSSSSSSLAPTSAPPMHAPWGANSSPSKEDAQRRRRATLETSARSRGTMLTNNRREYKSPSTNTEEAKVRVSPLHKGTAGDDANVHDQKEQEADPYSHLPSYMRPTATSRSRRQK